MSHDQFKAARFLGDRLPKLEQERSGLTGFLGQASLDASLDCEGGRAFCSLDLGSETVGIGELGEIADRQDRGAARCHTL